MIIFNSLRKFFVLLGIGSLFFLIFYLIFFIFLASLSVDGLIGFSMFVLFYIIYRFGGNIINRFFLSISRTVWSHFVSLILVTYLIKQLFFNNLNLLKNNFIFQIITNYFIFFELDKVLSELNLNLLNKFLMNGVLLELYYKHLIIKNLIDKNIISNEVISFLINYFNIYVYYFNNTIGWFK